MIDDEEEDARRETAIDESKALQSDSDPSRRVTQRQLSKLHELRKRRLQIQSKFQKKFKDGTSRHHGRHLKDKKDSASENEDSSLRKLKSNNEDTQNKAEEHHSPKKRQKLHWGLDTKERWERKANM